MNTSMVQENAQITEGEVVDLSRDEAANLTHKIRDCLTLSHSLIQQAWERRAWVSLGYSSWDDYVQGEFRDLVLTPPLEKRQSTVVSMSDAGMSLRAIASATEMSHMTVKRALQEARESGDTQPRTPRVGLDGKTYPSERYKEPAVVDLDDSLLDLDADSIGVTKFEPTRDSKSNTSLSATQKMHSHEPVREDRDETDPLGLTEARAAVKSAGAAIKATLEAAGDRMDVSQVDENLLTDLAYSMVVTAGLVDVLVRNNAPMSECDRLTRELEVGAATIDRAVDTIRRDSDD